jgi:glycosyltransferase involved in cell wall biosynthesis
MGKEGRKIVEKYYTWDHMAQELENYLKNFTKNS